MPRLHWAAGGEQKRCHFSPAGHVYFHFAESGETSWHHPSGDDDAFYSEIDDDETNGETHKDDSDDGGGADGDGDADDEEGEADVLIAEEMHHQLAAADDANGVVLGAADLDDDVASVLSYVSRESAALSLGRDDLLLLGGGGDHASHNNDERDGGDGPPPDDNDGDSFYSGGSDGDGPRHRGGGSAANAFGGGWDADRESLHGGGGSSVGYGGGGGGSSVGGGEEEASDMWCFFTCLPSGRRHVYTGQADEKKCATSLQGLTAAGLAAIRDELGQGATPLEFAAERLRRLYRCAPRRECASVRGGRRRRPCHLTGGVPRRGEETTTRSVAMNHRRPSSLSPHAPRAPPSAGTPPPPPRAI